jgi:beta-glucosidase-like glycosyl hydrolase
MYVILEKKKKRERKQAKIYTYYAFVGKYITYTFARSLAHYHLQHQQQQQHHHHHQIRLGLFNARGDPSNPYTSLGPSDVGTDAHNQLALDAARQAVTMLKNDGSMPLSPASLATIALIGPNANATTNMQGNYEVCVCVCFKKEREWQFLFLFVSLQYDNTIQNPTYI